MKPRTIKNPATISPTSASSGGPDVTFPSDTKFVSSATMMPEFFSPMNAMKSPIPTPIDDFNTSGTAPIMSFRIPVTVSTKNAIPEMNTAPRAVCQLSPCPSTTV